MADYSRQQVRFGVGGLDLRRAADAVSPQDALRLSNVQRDPEGAWTPRFGQTSLATSAGTNLHSAARAVDPVTPTTTRLWGIDGGVYRGLSGALGAAIDTGYSGNPLALVPWQVELSGESWMIVGDSNKVRKVRVSDGLVLPIGLPADSVDAATALDTELTVTADTFNGSAGSYTANAGTGAAPTLSNVAPGGNVANALRIQTAAGAATGPYYNYATRAVAIDFGDFGAGNPDATDDDYMHLWLRMNRPDLISEVRIYFIISAINLTAALPGSTGITTTNTDAYMKSFRPSDINSYIQTLNSSTSAVDVETVRRQINRATGGVRPTQDGDGNVPSDSRDTARNVAAQTTPGQLVWTEWGSVDIPLRRGDFTRIGTTENFGWADITGILISVHVASATSVPYVELAELYLTGGAGPDAGSPDTEAYDYRYTHYDPRTGAEGNMCPIQPDSEWLRPTRRGVDVTPDAYGDAAVRQRIYRRGGTLPDNWYFVGVNSSDGGVFTDTLSDGDIEGAGTAPIDHYQAVPSVTVTTGAEDLAQPTPYWWGPVNNIVFTAGDPNRPGSVYYCYPGQIDHWGADNYLNVASPTEAITNGFVYAGQSYAWSTQRLYAITPNLLDELTITAQPTPCAKAPAASWAFAVGPSSVFFIANDGFYQTNGGDALNLSDNWLRPLFLGQTSNGLLPIDFSATTALRVEVYLNEVWFQYRDSGGTNRALIYGLLDQSWRSYSFGTQVSCMLADTVPGSNSLILGGRTTGDAYAYSGTSDNGSAIACNIRTGTLNQGDSEADKLYADVTVDAVRDGATLTVTPYLTNETVAATALSISTGTGRQRYPYSFSPQPTRGSNLALDVAWSSASALPKVYVAQLSYALMPSQATAAGIDYENLGDTYLTGLNLVLDTFGLAKTIEIYAQIEDDAPALISTQTIPAISGRRQVDISLPTPIRGHLYKFQFTDANPYELFAHTWITTPEPSEQANLNGQFENAGTLADKYVKGVLVEIDTFGLTKTLAVQIDGVTHTTLSVATTGRKVVQFSFAQGLGRVLRLIATDTNPGRMYSYQWVFDTEPLALSRWETQLITHGLDGWQIPTYAYVTLKSTATVTYELIAYNQNGTSVTGTYTIPSTDGVKRQVFVPFIASKGTLFEHTLTSSSAFWLYRDESKVCVSPWGSQESVEVKPWGNDDIDHPTRPMGNASAAAAAPNRV